MLLEPHPQISRVRQCELLDISRSGTYYRARAQSPLGVRVMHRIDELYTQMPYYGSRRMTAHLQQEGFAVNRKRVTRLMRDMGLVACYPRPKISVGHPAHTVYPYLLKGLPIMRPNQVWGTDITYIRLQGGFVYLVALLDWRSRYVLSWRLSNTMDTSFCIEALEHALRDATPAIHNSDQGSQFTSEAYTKRLIEAGVAISMDGRGRCFDNIFTERLWRSVKYEEVYLKEYRCMNEAFDGLSCYFDTYNNVRLHQALNYQTPKVVHFGQNEPLRPTVIS